MEIGASRRAISPYTQPKVENRSQKKTSLPVQVLGAATAASVATLGVSLPVTFIDASIIKATHLKQPVFKVFKELRASFVKKPMFMYNPTRYTGAIYLGTYLTNNIFHTIEKNTETPKSWDYIKLGVTSTVNTLLSVRAVVLLTQLFGGAPQTNYPPVARAFFYTRDVATMASAFTIPPIVTGYLKENSTYCAQNPKTTETVAQLLSPVVPQMAITFIHLCGVALSNPQIDTTEKVLNTIAQAYRGSLGMRVLRGGLAYGMAGVVNKQVETWFND